MIKLNLISPAQQEYLKAKAIYVSVENVLGWLVVVAMMMAIILIPFNDKLSILNEQLTYEKNRAVAENQLLTDKIRDLKNRIEVLDLLQNNNYAWTNLLTELAKLAPTDISIIQFNANLTKRQFSLQGFARARDNFLEFKEKLGQAATLADLQSPLTDILKKEEVTFEIKGSLK